MRCTILHIGENLKLAVYVCFSREMMAFCKKPVAWRIWDKKN
jgi:hypothetical protein